MFGDNGMMLGMSVICLAVAAYFWAKFAATSWAGGAGVFLTAAIAATAAAVILLAISLTTKNKNNDSEMRNTPQYQNPSGYTSTPANNVNGNGNAGYCPDANQGSPYAQQGNSDGSTYGYGNSQSGATGYVIETGTYNGNKGSGTYYVLLQENGKKRVVVKPASGSGVQTKSAVAAAY